MKKVWKQGKIWVIMLLAVFHVMFDPTVSQAAEVTTSTVRILIGDETSARHHMSIAIGEISEEYSYEVKGYEVKSSSYSSSNTEAFTIQDTEAGKCKVEAISQGTGLVTLTIRTKDGKTLKESVFVSVYENIPECEGIAKRNAGMYRGASDNSGVENDDRKGEFPEGESFFVTAVCDDYYRFLRKAENEPEDGFWTGFVKMSDVTIPLTSISIEEELFLTMGEEETIEVETEPEYAPLPQLSFQSNNPAVVTVDGEGNIKTGKAGTAIVTVSTADGAHELKCTVYVYTPSEAAWLDSSGADDVPGTEGGGASGNQKTKKNKFNFQVNGYTDKSIKLTWDKQKKVKRYEIQRATKKNGKYETIKKLKASKKKYIDKNVEFYKKYWYRLVVVKKNGKILKSNRVKGRTKDSVVDLNLRVTDVQENSVTLKWKKQKYAEKYVVKRKDIWGGEKDFTDIKVFENGETSYVDQTADQGRKYEYKVQVKKSNKKANESNVVEVKTLFAYDNDTNIRLFRELYPFVCTDEGQDMNQYSVFDEYYSPIKYSYANGTLTIHLYCEFAQYVKLSEGNYEKKSVDSIVDENFDKYRQIFRDGLHERYEIVIANREKEHEFQNMNFDIKFILHEKDDKNEIYHVEQVFNEILIGEECPGWMNNGCSNSKSGNYWYHEETTFYDGIARIYMPYSYQISNNTNKKRQEMTDTGYAYTAAHEVGHMLGLGDAYPTSEGYDRFTDNDETGVLESEALQRYDNIMAERAFDKYLMPNDLQMMFKSYMDSQGKSWTSLERYKTNEDAGIEISECILNQEDYYNDTEWKAYYEEK